MNTKIIGIVVAAIVVVAAISVAAFWTDIFEDPYWETETDFGIWGEEIIITYEDGSEESLKIINDMLFTTVDYGGKSISSVSYRLSAKATGTVYTGADIDLSGYDIRVNFKSGTTVKTYRTFSGSPTIQAISIDGVFHQIGDTHAVSIKHSSLFGDVNLFPTGSYTIQFLPTGTIRYRGSPGGDWETASLPTGKTMSVDVIQEPTAQITVTLSSEYVVS